jgi:hypothetical protein
MGWNYRHAAQYLAFSWYVFYNYEHNAKFDYFNEIRNDDNMIIYSH